MLVFAPVADPIKLYFFANKEFLCFLLLSYIILLSVIFFYMEQNTQTKQRKSENEEKKLYRIGSLPDFVFHVFNQLSDVGNVG
jgi:hypothetical protein